MRVSDPVDSYLDALVVAQDVMNQSDVYVFMADRDQPTGQLVSLPFHSTVQDALSAFDALPGQSDDYILWRNGRKARPEDMMESGDVLWVAPKKEEIIIN